MSLKKIIKKSANDIKKWGSFLYYTATLLLYCHTVGLSAAPSYRPYEHYLNSITTLSGNFTQVNSKGQRSSGTIQISRPGKMRLDYTPPSPLLIVADGEWLMTYDKQQDEVNYLTLDKTPATFILRPHIRFQGDVMVTRFLPKDTTTEISLVRTEDPDAGYITLVFNNKPISLKEWSVVDAQGVETKVQLSDLKSNVTIPAEIFRINSPNLIQQIF